MLEDTWVHCNSSFLFLSYAGQNWHRIILSDSHRPGSARKEFYCRSPQIPMSYHVLEAELPTNVKKLWKNRQTVGMKSLMKSETRGEKKTYSAFSRPGSFWEVKLSLYSLWAFIHGSLSPVMFTLFLYLQCSPTQSAFSNFFLLKSIVCFP